MARGATLALKITGDASGGIKALGDVEGKSSSIMGGLGKLGGVVAGAFAVDKILDFGQAIYQAASDVQQSTGAIDAVFGDWSLDIEQSAQKAVDSVGLSTSAYENMAAVIGAQLKGMGQDVGDATTNTQGLISRGADLAAVFGGSTSDAVEALSSALKGEFDPLERYGVSLKQSTINAELAARGQDKLTGSALQQAQASAVLDLINRKTADSQGQFAAQSDTSAVAVQKLGAWFDNLKASLGERLLPIVTRAADFLRTTLGPVFGQVTAAGGPLQQMFGVIGRIVQGVLIPVLKGAWSFIKTYLAPIFGSILRPAIDGVRAAFGFISSKIAENKDKFIGLYNAIKPVLVFFRDHVAPVIGTLLGGAFTILGKAIGVVVDAIAWVVDKITWLIDKGGDLLQWVGGLFGAADTGAGVRGAAPVRGASRGGLFTAAGSLTGAGAGPSGAGGGLIAAGDTYNITVTGALDPAAVADQIQAMLDRRAARTGRRLAGAIT